VRFRAGEKRRNLAAKPRVEFELTAVDSACGGELAAAYPPVWMISAPVTAGEEERGQLLYT